MHTLQFRAMNTSVQLAAQGQGWAEAGLLAAQRAILEGEARFSRFRPESELSQLNQRSGQWVTVSADMLELLQLSVLFNEETGRLFDPSILPDLKRAGYDRTFDEVRAGQADLTTAAPRTPRPALAEIEFDLPSSRVRLPAGLELDLGGIAKGWIAEQAASLLEAHTDSGAVNAGGDMVFIGWPLGDPDWLVYLEDPRDPSVMLAELHIPSGAVATSSVVKRAWTRNGQARHHLIDPRTGEPARTEWLSVTVTAASLTVAEVYAKALLIGGTRAAASLLAGRPEVRYLAVDAQGNLSGSTELVSAVATSWSALNEAELATK